MLKAFTILDTKVGTFSPPMFFTHTQLCFRALIEVSQDPQSQLFKYPEDFTLYMIGEFDPLNGQMLSAPPVSLGNMVQLKTM